VLEVYGIEPQGDPAAEAPGGLAGRLLGLLAEAPASVDELARATGIAPGDVAAALIELELTGRVSEGDGVYRPTLPP
jgi:predicted Rossmann fold nucleotide-binding protein DprA/Smf involved in DNA uptake